MNEYSDELDIDQATLEQCDFSVIDDRLIVQGSGNELFLLLKEAEEKLDDKLAKLYKVIIKLFLLNLEPDSSNEPYTTQGKVPASSIFSINDLNILAKMAPYVQCAAFRARIYDIRWVYCKPRNKADADNAIEFYLSYPVDDDTWITSNVECYYKRALKLGLFLGKGAKGIVDEIKRRLFAALYANYESDKLMRLLIAELLNQAGLASDEKKNIADDFTQEAERFFLNRDYYVARFYFSHAADLYNSINLKEFWVNSLVRIANSRECEADESNVTIQRWCFYEDAIAAYREIPKASRATRGIDKKISELRIKHKELGQSVVNNMTAVSIGSLDVSDIAKNAASHVSGKVSVESALQYFCGLSSMVDKGIAETAARETLERGVAARFFDSIQLSNDGRKIGYQQSVSLDGNNIDDKVVMYYAVDAAIYNASFFVQSSVLPALHNLINEHHISLSDMERLCAVSSVVPRERSKLFAKGLFSGFEYDFSSAIHLLVPQWENIVRLILKESDVLTTVHNEDGTDMECGLSTLLEKAESDDIFDKDFLFQMRAFLVHQKGPNLRNEIAHGLLNYDDANSLEVIYWWWFSLRWVIRTSVCY